MALRGQAITAFLAPIALCVALLGAWTVYEESADVTFEPGLSSIGRVVRTIGNDDAGGLWTRTQQSVLKSCERTLLTRKSLEMRYLPPETQDALAPHCRQTALNAAARFPTDSYAWSVGSLAAADMQDWSAMNDALVRSQLTGPSEAWIARLRIVVAQDNYAMLDEPARLAAEQDLRLLLVSNTGIHALAQRYIGDVDFRRRIELQVETMPPEIQRRFINIVRYRMS